MMAQTDAFGIRFKVAENGPNAEPSIEILWLDQTQGHEDTSPAAIGRKNLFLRFSRPKTFDEAQIVARELNNQFSELSMLSFP
jgi:hypothetical protein